MGKYCPGCGSEVKEGSKFCQNCGAQIKSENKINSFEDQVAQPQKQQTSPAQFSPQTPAPPPQQQIGQTQAYAPIPPKRQNNKLIASVVVIIVVIILIGIIFLLFFGGVSESRFVGNWEQQGGYPAIWTINSDGSFESIGIEGTWRLNDGKFCIKSDILGEYAGEICYDYQFSDNGNTLTLSFFGTENLVFTKK